MLVRLSYEWGNEYRMPILLERSPESGGAVVLDMWLSNDIQFLTFAAQRAIEWLESPGDDLVGGGNTCHLILYEDKALLQAIDVMDREGRCIALTTAARLRKLLLDAVEAIEARRVGARFDLLTEIDAEGHEASNAFWKDRDRVV